MPHVGQAFPKSFECRVATPTRGDAPPYPLRLVRGGGARGVHVKVDAEVDSWWDSF